MDLELAKRKAILDRKIKEGSDSIRSGADSFLQDNIVNPLYSAGYENLGPAIGAIGSSAVEYVTPQSTEDVALGLIPGGKQASGVRKAVMTSDEKIKAMRQLEQMFPGDPVKVAQGMRQLEMKADIIPVRYKGNAEAIKTDNQIGAVMTPAKQTPNVDMGVNYGSNIAAGLLKRRARE